MRVVLFCETAQMREPISNQNIATRKVVLRGKYLYAFPHVAWKEARVRKNAEPYQPTWSKLWKSSVILGIAVATMVCWRWENLLVVLERKDRVDRPYHI